jgi:hypothetical protein
MEYADTFQIAKNCLGNQRKEAEADSETQPVDDAKATAPSDPGN